MNETIIAESLKNKTTEEMQELINRENAALVFMPEFIQYRPAIQKSFKLTHVETLIYGFIRYYLTSAKPKFFFTNKQIGELFSCSDRTVSAAVNNLAEKRLLTVNYVSGANGAVRFINWVYIPDSDLVQTEGGRNIFEGGRKKQHINDNSINNNININNNAQIDKNSFSSLLEIYLNKYNAAWERSARPTAKRLTLLKARLKTYSFEEIEKSLISMSKNKFFLGDNDRNWFATPEYHLRNDENIEKFLEVKGRKRDLSSKSVFSESEFFEHFNNLEKGQQ